MPTSHRLIRRLATIPAVALLASALACAGRGKPGTPQPDIPLVVHNSAFNDVIIYAVPSGADTRVRIGNVTGNSDARFSVRRSLMRAEGILVLNLRAIGSRYSWTTPSLSVQQGDAACLDIFADASGDLSRSAFYIVTLDEPPDLPADSTVKPAPRRPSHQRISCRSGG